MKCILLRSDYVNDMYLETKSGTWGEDRGRAMVFNTERAADIVAASLLLRHDGYNLNSLKVLKAPKYYIGINGLAIRRDGATVHPGNNDLKFPTSMDASHWLCLWANINRKLVTHYTIEEDPV